MTTQKPIRFLMGTQDGHDEPMDDMIQYLRRDGRFEVIYGGINQTPEGLALQALQEDVDILGFSLYAGAHIEVCRAIVKTLADRKEEIAFVIGGIIPHEDEEELRAIGVDKIIYPGTDPEEIITTLYDMCLPKNRESKQGLLKRARAGDQSALARLITNIERGTWRAPRVSGRRAKSSHVVGLSAAGGAGKSTLIGCLYDHFKSVGSLGVLFSDPPSASGGAILLDRVKAFIPQDADELVDLPHVYARSLAARAEGGVLAKNLGEMIRLLQWLGKDTVIVESAGAGQADVGFGELVDTFVFVATPDMGDKNQILKGGVIETADIIVLNKRDKSGAYLMETLLRQHYGTLRSDGWQVPVVSTEADVGRGVGDLVAAIADHRSLLGK